MGLVLETSYLAFHDRSKRGVVRMLSEVEALHGDDSIFISAISVAELAHGTRRTTTADQLRQRLQFFNDTIKSIRVLPVTTQIATLAGRIEGDLIVAGQKVPLPDILIAATALYLDFPLLTFNLRHFNRIPGLTVLTP